jgi:hypothetical protein
MQLLNKSTGKWNSPASRDAIMAGGAGFLVSAICVFAISDFGAGL